MKQKTIIVFLIFIFAAIALSGCRGDEGSDGSTEQALQNGDYAGAVSIADATLADGADKMAGRAKGIALMGQGQYEQAVQAFVEALACSNGIIEATDIDISYYLAVAEYKSGDAASALSTTEAICALRPKDDGAYFLKGKIELASGDKDAALSDFDKTIELADDNYDRYVGIYEELHARGYDAEAASYLEKAMTAGNRLSDYNKGVLEYYLGAYTDARGDLEEARKSGSSENLILYLGRTYEALGDPAYAITLYESFIRENPTAGSVYEELANCRMNAGDYEGALSTIEAGMNAGGGEGKKGMMFDRAVAYEMMYDFENAAKYMQEYLAEYPDDEVAKRENLFLSTR